METFPVATISRFEQIAPQLAEILQFLSAEETRESTRLAVRLRRRMTATMEQELAEEDASLEELCVLRHVDAARSACQLALDCAEGQNLVAKGSAQAALGAVQAWNELEKQRDAQQRRRKK